MILQGVVNPDNNCQENGQFSHKDREVIILLDNVKKV